MPRSFIIIGEIRTFVSNENDRFVEMDKVCFATAVGFLTALLRSRKLDEADSARRRA